MLITRYQIIKYKTYIMTEIVQLTKDIVIQSFDHKWEEKANSIVNKMLLKGCTCEDGYILRIIEPIIYKALPLDRNDFRVQFRASITVERFIPKEGLIASGKITKITSKGAKKNINVILYDKQLVLVNYTPLEKSDTDDSFIHNNQTYSVGSLINIKIIRAVFQELPNLNKYTFVCIGHVDCPSSIEEKNTPEKNTP